MRGTVTPVAQDQVVHHPWRRLRDRLPDWDVVIGALPSGVLGATDTPNRTIYVVPGLLQGQRRAVVDHELIHAEDGDVGCQSRAREAEVDRQSAGRLISFDRLLDAWLWSYSVEEMADELWVDVATVRCRIDNLSNDERATVRAALAERDFHEEGQPCDG